MARKDIIDEEDEEEVKKSSKTKKDSKDDEEAYEKSKIPILAILLGLVIVIIIIVLLFKGCSKKEEYIVIFDTNGGSEVNSATVYENDTVSKPIDPTREGYKFIGWYYKDELFDFNTKITKDMTLTAQWAEISDELSLNTGSISVLLGEQRGIEVISLPEGVTKDNLIWTSSDPSIASVDANGNIKALKAGTVTITVKTSDGKYTAQCSVTVTATEKEVESVTINGVNELTEGESARLTVSFTPSDATNTKVTWTSSDPSIASVDANGNIKALKTGTVTITVTSSNGKKATKTIKVNQKTSNKTTSNKTTSNKVTSNKNTVVEATGVTISGQKEVYVGSTIKLTATVTPSNTTNKKVTWTSSDLSIASVDANGNVKGLAAGTVTITVKTSNDKTATYQVTVKVKEPVYKLHLKAIPMEGIPGVFQYQFRITKDGSSFNDYKGFTLNGKIYMKVNSDPTVEKGDVSTGENEATITLSNGEVKKLNVVFE